MVGRRIAKIGLAGKLAANRNSPAWAKVQAASGHHLAKLVLTWQAVMQLHLARQRSKGDCDSSESDSPSGPSGDLGVPASQGAAEGSYSAAQAMVRDR